MIVSIHQPNYMPWVGFFEKIYLSDIFIYFDNIQMPKNKSFVSRNKIFFNKKSVWLTVPINKKGIQSINKVKIVDNFWKKKHLNTIYHAYSKKNYFYESFSQIKDGLLKDNVYLADLNIQIIKEILKLLNIRNVKIIKASELSLQKQGAQSIFEILNLLNAKVYLSGSGSGSSKYINQEVLKKFNIQLRYCNTKLEKYYSFQSDKIEIVSILDLLFCIGINNILKIFQTLK